MSFVCPCDYDSPEFWSARDVRAARKPFVCEECGARCQPGEPYESVTGKWGGWLNTFKTCRRCVELRAWMTNNIPCFCWAHGNLFEDVIETARAARSEIPDETRGLLFGALRRVERIRRHATETRKAP